MRKILTRLVCLAAFFLWIALPMVRAQEGGVAEGETVTTNPKDRELSVTATVPVISPPPAPILISPENHAILTSGVVTFVWRAVTGHLVPLDRYELIINGVQRYGDIPLVNHSTDDYVLTFDGTDYHLALRQDKYLADGFYTWRVRVVDANDRGTDSTTWDFTIDSQPPSLIITSIDGEDVVISAADPSSIPAEPVEVSHRQPEIIGRSDPGAEVQLTVTFPDGTTKQYKASADVNGFFGFTLEALPLGEAVTLKFVAIDAAGLSRVLDGLQLIYHPPTIIIPIPPIIPGLPPVIEIPIEIPEIPRLPSIFPTPFPGFIPPTAPPLRVIEVPVFTAGPWVGVIFFGLLAYLLTLFIITGNPWSWLMAFAASLLRFFFWPSPPREHELREQEEKKLLPWCGFSLIWLDARRRIKTRRLLSDLAGRWETKFSADLLYQLALHTKYFEYPADRISVSEARPVGKPRELYLSGESFWFYDEAKMKPKSKVEYFTIPQKLSFRFVAWVRRWRRPGLGKWVLRLPRLFLLLALAAAFWILWHVPLWWSMLLVGLVLWILLRDWRAKIPRQLEVYVS